MQRTGRQISIAVILSAAFTCAQAQQSELPSAPMPPRSTAPPASEASATQPKQQNQKPAPAVFESLTPRKAVQPPDTNNAPQQSGQNQKSNTDPIGSPDAAPKPAAPAVNSESAPSQTATANQDEQYVFRSDPREVDVVFTVTDKHGRFVKNLTANDIKILDNKKPPERVVSFNAQSDLPLRVGLLIDASGSIRERFKFEQQTAAEFMASIIRPMRDKAFILGFDSSLEVTQDFTNDTSALAKGVKMLRPGGGTALYDAIYDACRHKLWHTGDRESVRKAIIVVSDGDDNQSRVTREEAIEMAQRAEVIIFAISTNNTGTFQKGDDVLGQLASATGGQAFYPFKIENLGNAFNDVQEELRSQYVIAYIPSNFEHDGSFRTIDIQVADKKYKARARRGYFAQKAVATASAGKGD